MRRSAQRRTTYLRETDSVGAIVRTFPAHTACLQEPGDLSTFLDPPDAALMFGFRGLAPGDDFRKSQVVWMATMRRRAGKDAIVESVQPIFPKLADQGSLEQLLLGIAERAHGLGYEKVWLASAVLSKEPLMVPALKTVTEKLGTPLMYVPSSGMSALVVSPKRP